MQNELMHETISHGDRAVLVPITRLDDLTQDMKALEAGSYHTGYIDWAARRRERFQPSGLDFEARSLLIVASHSPVRTVGFGYEGRAVQTMLPPTYADYEARETGVTRYLNEFLNPGGLHAALAGNLPYKLLATRCGLGEYGRNNIFYCGDWGSYVNLVALYTDVPCEDGPWFPARRMQACERCRACVDACPTGAIDADRMIIDAGRCLTNLNEDKKNEFPDWLDASSHNALVGCMKCQACCPGNVQNAGFVVESCTFDEAETRCILEHKAGEEYPEGIAHKLKDIGMHWYRDALPRNLAVLLRR